MLVGTFTIKISMEIVFHWHITRNNSSQQWSIGGDILSFHIFEALNDNFEA